MSLKLCRNFLDDFDAVGAVAVNGENVVGDINQEGCPDGTASAMETQPHARWSASSRHAFPPALRWRWREPRSSRRPDVSSRRARASFRALTGRLEISTATTIRHSQPAELDLVEQGGRFSPRGPTRPLTLWTTPQLSPRSRLSQAFGTRSRPLETSQPSGARAKNERSESVQGS